MAKDCVRQINLVINKNCVSLRHRGMGRVITQCWTIYAIKAVLMKSSSIWQATWFWSERIQWGGGGGFPTTNNTSNNNRCLDPRCFAHGSCSNAVPIRSVGLVHGYHELRGSMRKMDILDSSVRDCRCAFFIPSKCFSEPAEGNVRQGDPNPTSPE